jgi:oxygen-independent coproporphyrinogen-3 oxidase
VGRLVADGLLEPPGTGSAPAGRLVLTLRGRLLADAVVRALLGWDDEAAGAA